jgi:hypothetical protein
MHFRTMSGAHYHLSRDAILTRDPDVNMVNYMTGVESAPDFGGERVEFRTPPTVGQRFHYYHPVLSGCSSTPIVRIWEDDEEEPIYDGEVGW